MTRETITTIGYMGKPWTITGDLTAGLLVHKMGSSWCITHAETGLRIGAGRRLRRDALAVRAQLLALLPDWSRAETPEALARLAGRTALEFSDAVRAIAY